MSFSETDAGILDCEGLLAGLIRVASDEVLEQQLGVGEVGRVVPVRLTMAAHQGLLKIGCPPDPALHLLTLEQMLTLSNELVSAELHILVEQVATKYLLAVLVVDEVADDEEGAEGGLGDERHVLVVEHDVVVVQEDERSQRGEHHKLLVVRVLNIQVSHIIVPLRIMWVQEHGIKGELGSNSLGNVEKVEHLLNGLVTLLSHTSVYGNKQMLSDNPIAL